MKTKKPSLKLIKETASLLAREATGNHPFNGDELIARALPLRHKLARLMYLVRLRTGKPWAKHDPGSYRCHENELRYQLDELGVGFSTSESVGNLAGLIASIRMTAREGYRFGKWNPPVHGRYPTRTPVALIRKLTLEFIADPLSNYAKIPYCSLKRVAPILRSTDFSNSLHDVAIFASPTYGTRDYNKVEVKLDTPLAKQAFATAMKLAEKVYERAKMKQTA